MSAETGLIVAKALARMLQQPSRRRLRTGAVAGLALWLAPLSSAYAQATASVEAPPGPTPSSVTSQLAAVGAPATTHPALTNDDATQPPATEGGPALPPAEDLPQMLRLEDALRVLLGL